MRTLSVVDVVPVLLAGPCTCHNANPGDVIKVQNTAFTESPVISKDLTLTAAKPDDLAMPARGVARTTLALMSCPRRGLYRCPLCAGDR